MSSSNTIQSIFSTAPLASNAAALLVSAIVFFIWRWFEAPANVSIPEHMDPEATKHEDPEACRKLGLTGESNLADEHDPKYAGALPDQTIWTVKSLWIYPVKSCHGVELENGTTVGTGLHYDRQFAFALWMKVSKGDEIPKMGWKFLTQRESPLLATVTPEVWVPDPSSPDYSEDHPNVLSGGVVVIKYPAAHGGTTKAVKVPYLPTPDQVQSLGYRTQPMVIWKDSPDAILMTSTKHNDKWIDEVRAYLDVKTPLALFRVKNMHSRALFRNAPRVTELGYQSSVGFQDAYPLHVISLASVQDVGSKFHGGSTRLSARNFRPNIIIAGGPPYAEDCWKRIRVGNEEYYTSCRCVRCLLPNVNQDTGKRHASEPNRTLKDTRIIDKGDTKNACLGMQMLPAVQDERTIRVGDTIAVVESGEHFYIKQ